MLMDLHSTVYTDLPKTRSARQLCPRYGRDPGSAYTQTLLNLTKLGLPYTLLQLCPRYGRDPGSAYTQTLLFQTKLGSPYTLF